MKLLVCGGRDFDNLPQIHFVLKQLRPSLVIHGAARGADRQAGQAAKLLGIEVAEYPADWEKHGKSAGFKRNEQMLRESDPDLVLAFFGGNGTTHMKHLARRNGYTVLEVMPIRHEDGNLL